MSFKVKHYAAKTVDARPQLDMETFILELFFGVVSAVFAIGGYQADVLLLMVPCALVAITCLSLVLHTCYLFISDKLKNKEKSS